MTSKNQLFFRYIFVHPASMLRSVGPPKWFYLNGWVNSEASVLKQPSSERKWQRLRLLATEKDYECTNFTSLGLKPLILRVFHDPRAAPADPP